MPSSQIPVEVVFSPAWWHRHYGIVFDEPFYLDLETRIQNDVRMRAALFERFGLGEPNPQPRPVIGSMHVAGGFVLPALFGAKIRFAVDQAPWPEDACLSRDEILALQPPDLRQTWPLNRLLSDMDRLAQEFGYVCGDFDTDGLLNTALHLRGQQLFLDFAEDPDLVEHLSSILAETTLAVALLLRERTGSCAIATNRSILHFDPRLYLHSNCSVSMVSPRIYEKFLLSHELRLAGSLQPYGIHHCGDNLHRYAHAYRRVPAAYFDVGWGSDVAACRRAFPQAFLNLRLSPVRMLQCRSDEIYQDTLDLIKAAGSPGKVGVCCINMDADTPDDNVLAMFSAVKDIVHREAYE